MTVLNSKCFWGKSRQRLSAILCQRCPKIKWVVTQNGSLSQRYVVNRTNKHILTFSTHQMQKRGLSPKALRYDSLPTAFPHEGLRGQVGNNMLCLTNSHIVTKNHFIGFRHKINSDFSRSLYWGSRGAPPEHQHQPGWICAVCLKSLFQSVQCFCFPLWDNLGPHLSERSWVSPK